MNQTLPPQVQLIEMMLAPFTAKMIYVAAKLKLPDLLAAGPRSAEDLASATGAHAGSLYRIMRTLASKGFFDEDDSRRFSLLPLGEVFKAGTPNHATVLLMGSDLFGRPLDNLLYCAQTGKNGFDKTWGKPAFEYLSEHPDEALLFNEMMVGFHGMEPPAVAAAYDFSAFRTIVDVGGGTGNLLTTILERHPGPRGILFDLPHVASDATALIDRKGMKDRIDIEAGSFFERVPQGADAYVMSHVIHDWNDEQSVSILGHCRKAIQKDGRLLLVETVVPAGNLPHPSKMLDIVMLVMNPGKERSESEYRALFKKADFELTRIVPTESPVSVIEAVPC
jgi:hypothetical protein